MKIKKQTVWTIITFILVFMASIGLLLILAGCEMKEKITQICKENCYAQFLNEFNSSNSTELSVGRIMLIGEEKNNCLKACDSR